MIAIKHNAFSDNLGTDFIAVDAAGNILCRAGTKDGARQAAPDAAHYLTAADIGQPVNTGPLEGAGVDYAAAEAASADAVAEVRADISTFLHDQRVAGEIDPAVAVEAEQPIASGLEPDAPVEPEEPVVADLAENELPDDGKPSEVVADGSAFDHDGDGAVGGSKPHSRKRKPAK